MKYKPPEIELTLTVAYTIYPAEPDVGIMGKYIEVESARLNGQDVTLTAEQEQLIQEAVFDE